MSWKVEIVFMLSEVEMNAKIELYVNYDALLPDLCSLQTYDPLGRISAACEIHCSRINSPEKAINRFSLRFSRFTRNGANINKCQSTLEYQVTPTHCNSSVVYYTLENQFSKYC